MNNLLETLREALYIAARVSEERKDEDSGQFRNALSLLSDPDTFIWRLLEEKAAEVTRCRRLPRRAEKWITSGKGDEEFCVSAWPDGDVTIPGSCLGSTDKIKNLILCLARAIQEQEMRDSEVSE